jgi:hypothetical protein
MKISCDVYVMYRMYIVSFELGRALVNTIMSNESSGSIKGGEFRD